MIEWTSINHINYSMPQSSQQHSEPIVSKQEPDPLIQRNQQEILAKIRSNVKILQQRIYSYGMSSDQFTQIMQKTLGNILNKNRRNAQKLGTPTDYMKAINHYVNKRASRGLKLLIEIINSIDEQITELESNSVLDESEETRKLKLEGNRHQYSEGDSQNLQKMIKQRSRVFDNPVDEPAFYVKLETIPGEEIEEEPESEVLAPRRRRGRSSGRKRNQ